jgi:hypothetical protein
MTNGNWRKQGRRKKLLISPKKHGPDYEQQKSRPKDGFVACSLFLNGRQG